MEIKIPLYEVIVRFCNGFVALGLTCILFPWTTLEIIQKVDSFIIIDCWPEIIIIAFIFSLAYEIGYFFDRIGSCIMEQIFKKLKWIPFVDNYVLYNDVKKEYPNIIILQREYAKCRTCFSLYLFVCLISLSVAKWRMAVLLLGVVVIYYLSWRRFASKIVKLMDASLVSG